MRKGLKKSPNPLLFRFMSLAASCVAFSLLASTGTKECVTPAAFRDAPRPGCVRTATDVLVARRQTVDGVTTRGYKYRRT